MLLAGRIITVCEKPQSSIGWRFLVASHGDGSIVTYLHGAASLEELVVRRHENV